MDTIPFDKRAVDITFTPECVIWPSIYKFISTSEASIIAILVKIHSLPIFVVTCFDAFISVLLEKPVYDITGKLYRDCVTRKKAELRTNISMLLTQNFENEKKIHY